MVKNVKLQGKRRAQIIQGLIFLFFGIYLLRLFDLQVIRGDIYKELSDQNRIRQVPVLPSRGIVLDRKENLLIGNRPSYSLYVIPFEFQRNLIDTAVGSKLMGITYDHIQRKIDAHKGSLFSPVRLIQDMNFSTLSLVEENRLDLPGVYYMVEPIRTYSPDIRASHVLGYTGEVDQQQLKMFRGKGYRLGDLIGKGGVEGQYEHLLKGQKGYTYREVDVRGREVGNFGGSRDILPIPGKNLMLTLDSKIQQMVENLFRDSKGSVIVMDPRNGEILAMVSKPDFNLTPFSTGLSLEMWESLRKDIHKPLLNRSTQAQFEPGSLFKLILAIAQLEAYPETINEPFNCPGHFRLGKQQFLCWNEMGHGEVNLLDGLKFSCNVYFYQLGLLLGVERIFYYGNLLGLGVETGVDLCEESSGLLPNLKYLDNKYHKGEWSRGMIVNLSIGQGDLLVTPMQMVRLACIIGSEGQITKPHLLRAIQDLHEEWYYLHFEIQRIRNVSIKTFQTVKEGMFRVVNEAGGTGGLAKLDDIEVCGKTGTAQNPHGEPHAWFLGFAPKNQPTIALVVILENGGSGSRNGAPVAGAILRHIFS